MEEDDTVESSVPAPKKRAQGRQATRVLPVPTCWEFLHPDAVDARASPTIIRDVAKSGGQLAPPHPRGAASSQDGGPQLNLSSSGIDFGAEAQVKRDREETLSNAKEANIAPLGLVGM